jgi:hypothetical protein
VIEIAGIWEIGRNVPLMEADLWKCAMRSYGLKRLNMTPITGIHAPWIFEFASVDEMIDAYPNHDPVFVDETAGTELEDFSHPTNALYVFGRSSYSPFTNMAKEHLSFRIECPELGMLWPHQCLPMILRDRGKK